MAKDTNINLYIGEKLVGSSSLKTSVSSDKIIHIDDFPLSKEEVFKEITTHTKWYIGYCSQGYASQIVQRFEDGRLSEKTIDKLFDHFGYSVSTPKQWVKQLDGKPSNLKTK